MPVRVSKCSARSVYSFLAFGLLLAVKESDQKESNYLILKMEMNGG